ncbi:IS1380-Spn1 transposase [Streptococcus pneumoniae]|nr:IS1380-Spn1 transposase [Streptococcus pneumoniae]
MSITSFVKRIQDITRNDAGVNGDAQRIEQMSWLLFLKIYDSREMVWELEEDEYESIIPEELKWRNWAHAQNGERVLTGDELLDFVNNKLFKELKELEITSNMPIRKTIVKSAFEDANNYMKNGVLLRQVINVIDEVDFNSPEDRHSFNDIYEKILKDIQNAGNSGEFYTPRAATDFIAEVLDPKLGESMADLACGTGGFLTSTLNRLSSQRKTSEDTKKYNTAVFGIEKKAFPHLLAVTNLFLHEIDDPKIVHGNTLEKNVREYTDDEKFDIIMMNPPFGGSELETIKNNFPAELRSSETADLFMAVIMYRLKENGRVGVILPDGFLFGEGVKTRLKQKLVDEFNLHTIIRLPHSVFAPYTGIHTNILFPQLFTPNLKTIQNPCLSLDPGWFLFSPNGCFLLDKKEFPLYGISVEKNTKRKETHMNSLPNHHFQNKSFYQLSFDGGHLTQYGGLIFFQELFSQLKLKERISKYLVTNDQRRYCRYSDSDILVQFLFQLLTGYGTDYACKELSADAYFPKLLEGGQLASQPTLSRFLSRTDEETVHSLRCLNLELVEFFLQFHQLNQLIVDIDSTHFTTYGKQEGVAYNAHYRAHGYHPLYAFEGKTGYCFNAQLRPGNRYCSEEADSFITPVLERFNQLLFRMDSGFATPKLYDLIEKTGQYYLIKLKKNTVLSRLGDLSLPCPQDEDLTILPHSAYSETLYQAGSWSHKRRVCQFSERKEGNLFYDVISLVTNMTSGTSQDQFQLYRGRGQAENFIKEMKEGFFGDKTDSSTLIKNEVRMMMSCIAYNLYLFLKHLAGGDFQTLTIKRFRHLFLHVVGKCVRTGRKQLLKLSSLYAYSELFSALYSRIRKVNLNLPVPYEPPRRKASLMMH